MVFFTWMKILMTTEITALHKLLSQSISPDIQIKALAGLDTFLITFSF